jgi:hypothetical protein
MKPVIRRSALSTFLGVAAVVSVTTNVLAAPPNWTAAETLRTRNDITLDDAAFGPMEYASVAWTEPTSGRRRIGVKSAVEGGFGPTQFISASRDVAVDLCGSSLVAAWERRVAPHDWRVVFSESSIDMNELAIGIRQVDPTPVDNSLPEVDVACTDSRSFVTWYESEGSGGRMFIAHRLFGGFSSPIDLGVNESTDFDASLAVAGAGSNAYTVFQRSDGDLRFKRFEMGAGPGFAVSAHPTMVIANGTVHDGASRAFIDAAGSKVAVVWSRCTGIFGRVSNDYGATWGPVRTLFNDFNSCEADAVAFHTSIAIRGGRIVVAYGIASAFGGGEMRIIRTTNDFASKTDDRIATTVHAEHLVGYTTDVETGAVKLAAAFQKGDVVRYRRQS